MNLSDTQLENIKKIAYFGYGYKNHIEEKWYAITQYMIWKEADQINGEVYFTNGLNGPKIDAFQEEITEINTLINEYNQELNIENKTTILVQNQNNKIYVGKELDNYQLISDDFQIDSEYLVSKNDLEEKDYSLTLTRKEENYQKPIIFYQSSNSQNLMEVGNLEEKVIQSTIKMIKTSITIHKVDSESNLIPQGEAKLDGAIMTLYDSNHQKIDIYEIKNNQVIIEDLDLGTYYIEETKPGVGYQENNKQYQITLSSENPKQELIIPNDVIKKKITIIKQYGEENNLQRESNIQFDIYQDQTYIQTVSTDEEGKIEIILPYGEYQFIQINSTEGYAKVDPFIVVVDSIDEKQILLKDYHIPVPNTKTKSNSKIYYLLLFIWKILCLKDYF